MIGKFFSGKSLLVRFTLVSLFVTVLIATGLAWRLESALERDAFSGVAANTADQATNVLNKHLTVADLKAALQGERYKEIDTLIHNTLIHNTLLSANIVRIKIWNRQGLLIYSDDKGIMGKTFPVERDLQEAFRGEIASDITTLQAGENIGERGLYEQLFEIYVPLQPSDSSAIMGAYEVYYDLSKLQPRLMRIRYTVWSGVGIAFLLLYGALFVLIRNASRELIQRNKENQVLLVAERRERDWLLEGDELIGFSAYGPGAEKFVGMRYPIYDPHLLGARVARERKPILINAALNSPIVDQKMIQIFDIKSMMGIPLVKGERVLGALMILDSENPQRFDQKHLETASVFGSHAALAIDNAQLYKKAQLHLKHEKALREIDLAITSNLDLSVTLQVVLNQTRTQLRVDACAILLLNQNTQTLEYNSGRGFRTEKVKETYLSLGDGSVGNAALEQRIFGQDEILSPAQVPERADLLAAEQFSAYFIAPLVSKNKLLGAMEIYHRSPLTIKTEWLKFFESLAGQTAIAIDNATLFADLQQSTIELSLAYDATIEGWSTALDLRDKETEGHTQRVVETTIKLAERMGIGSQELVNMRRGALLHDIGKMGIPDRILLKPDTLSDEEWMIMRMHPIYAYQMLKPITYLGSALDIPYCHHEKWDGTGYPRELEGEEIPLAARIFSIVDVYDALTSDRPYRAAWPKEKALNHIRQLSGTHFEPRVVEAFLQMLSEDQPLLMQASAAA